MIKLKRKQMDRVSLLFGVHMHQPVDNFTKAVDEAVERCYRPFFETMAEYPQFKFSLHCSGWLLEQIVAKHPDIYKNIQKLTKVGAIEWISAGFYEPVLSSIPSNDRVGQIKKLNTEIKKEFNTKPKGLWLSERVWESSIIPDIKNSNLEFALVDDYHFLSSGFDKSQMDGYFETEESGKKLALFPINEALRYALPFFSVPNAIKEIEKQSRGKNSAAIIFDDAEKFGLWPKTFEWVYEKGWLKEFIEAVLQNPNIKTEHFGEFLANNHSKGLAYLGNTSYFEMGEWSLREHQAEALETLREEVGQDYFKNTGIAFIKGGIWKNFFIKYEESNYLHKRMLYMSQKQKKMSKKAKEWLYKLQTNDVFWHGVFGGLYLPNLRDNAYRYLLELEKGFAKKETFYEIDDFDMDGYDELKVSNESLSLVFSSKNGAQMVEFGSLTSHFNWQNTLTRRKEAYHKKILDETKSETKEQNGEQISTIHDLNSTLDENLKENLVFDWHLKYSFIDHFCETPFDLEDFKKVKFKELGDFANQPFILDKKSRVFSRNGGIYTDKKHDTALEKSYRFGKNSFELSLKCKSDFKKECYYGVEFNLHFAHPDKILFNDNLINDGLNLKELKSLRIVDDFTNQTIKIDSNKKLDMSAYILKTISQSESGFDMVSQQICFILFMPFAKEFKLKLHIEVDDV